MKVTVDQATLADTLRWVGLALPARPALPVLSGIRLTATSESLEVEAYDLDASHSARIVANEGELTEDDDAPEESVIVSGHLLRDLVATLKSGPIELATDDDQTQLTITQRRTRYRLALMREDDWPGLPDHPRSVGSVAVADLLALLPGVADPINDSESGPSDFRGVRIETRGSGDSAALTLVGTSRSVLAVRAAGWTGSEMSARVPLSALENALRGFAGLPDARVSIGLSGGILGLSGDSRTGPRYATTRLYADKRVPWEKLVRSRDEDTITATLCAGDLIDALRRAALLGGRENASACLTLLPAGGLGVEANGGNASPGDGRDELDAEVSTSDPALLPLVVGVTPTFLADAIAYVVEPDADVRLGFAGQRKPITIRPADHAVSDSDSTAVTVLAPRTTGAR